MNLPPFLSLLSVLVGVVFASTPVESSEPYAAVRNQLVDLRIVAAGIRNPRVIDALRMTPRHEFVPPRERKSAYFDMALPIGHGQTISPPYIVAFMTEQLDPQPSDRVLEIGTGSGYQAAVLSPLVKSVYSIEIVEPLGQRAAKTLKRLAYENVFTKIGDGYAGWQEHAPFDKIIVTCSPEEVPEPLVQQLVDEGMMVIPVGERFEQTLIRYKKVAGRLQRENLQATFFVPMTGRSETKRKVLPNLKIPALINGNFEEFIEKSVRPSAWYYLRLATIDDQSETPAGGNAMKFANSTAGRPAHAMQAFGVDGQAIRELEVSFWLRAQRVRPGRFQDERAGILVEFYGNNRQAVSLRRFPVASGSFDWKQLTFRIRVPAATQLAVIGIGLFGATGEVHFDDVKIHSAKNRQKK